MTIALLAAGMVLSYLALRPRQTSGEPGFDESIPAQPSVILTEERG